ncbi:MAG: ABC transporter permease [Actinobacteria bacterium]|nr:ABC transporter permease [Actinomycetota bacterium]
MRPAPPSKFTKVTRSPTGIRSGWLLAIPLAAGIVLIALPLVALLLRALSDQGAGGFVDVLGNSTFLEALRRTVVLAAAVTGFCVVLGTVYSLALVVSPRPLSWALLAILMSAFWISLLVRTFGWVILFQPNGALNQFLSDIGLVHGSLNLLQTAPAMYPAMVHVLLPFFVLPVYASCRRLDPDQLRAAQSLGASPLSVLRHVVIAHLRPAIFAAAALVFMLALSFYVTPLLIGGPSELTIATLIDREFHEQFDLGTAAIMGLLLLAIVLAIYFVVDRFVAIVPTGQEEAR